MKSMKLMLQAEDKTYLTAKLASLSKSKSTIEQLSAWIASRKEYRRQLVRIWFDGLKAAESWQMLPYLYLANAVMANNGKMGKSFRREFMKSMGSAMKVLTRDSCEHTRDKVLRLLQFWRSKGIIEDKVVTRLEKVYNKAWQDRDNCLSSASSVSNASSCCGDSDTEGSVVAGAEGGSEGDVDEDKSPRPLATAPRRVSGRLSPLGVWKDPRIKGHGDSPYEPVDVYDDDGNILKADDDLLKLDRCADSMFKDMDHRSLLNILRSDADLRYRFLERMKESSSYEEGMLIEVILKPCDRNITVNETEFLSLLEILSERQLPSEDVSSRSTVCTFPEEFSDSFAALNLCADEWSCQELGKSIRNAAVVASDFLKRLELEMGLRADATWKLQAFAQREKEKLKVAEQILQEDRQMQEELLDKLFSLESFVYSIQNNSEPSTLVLPMLVETVVPLPSAQDLFLSAFDN